MLPFKWKHFPLSPSPPLGRARLPPCRLISGGSAISPDWWSIWIKNELYSQLASYDSCLSPLLLKSHSVYTFATLAAVHHAPPAPSPRKNKKVCGLWNNQHAVIRCSIGSIKPRPHCRTHDRGRTTFLIKLTKVLTMLILPSPSRRTLLEPSFLSEDTWITPSPPLGSHLFQTEWPSLSWFFSSATAPVYHSCPSIWWWVTGGQRDPGHMTHSFHSVPPHRCTKKHARRCTFRSKSEWVVWEVAVEKRTQPCLRFRLMCHLKGKMRRRG